MKQKRFFALTLVFSLLIGIFFMAPSASAVSNRPVKLIYAKPPKNGLAVGAIGYVEVENIAYEKNVTIHYSFDGVKWEDCKAEYYKPTWGNYEAWKFETPTKVPSYRGSITVEFAIKYEVNGQTYWDNNNGQNYSIHAGYSDSGRFDFGVGGIANRTSYRSNDFVSGWLQLKDLGDPKEVKVIYTTDNWETTNEVDAKYYTTFSQKNYVQEWSYKIPTNACNLQYKLSYTVNGITYIDDNFGNYYTA